MKCENIPSELIHIGLARGSGSCELHLILLENFFRLKNLLVTPYYRALNFFLPITFPYISFISAGVVDCGAFCRAAISVGYCDITSGMLQ